MNQAACGGHRADTVEKKHADLALTLQSTSAIGFFNRPSVNLPQEKGVRGVFVGEVGKLLKVHAK